MKQPKIRVKSLSLRSFERLTRDFLDASHELFPHEASELGLVRYEDRLRENTARTHLRYIALMEKALAATERLAEPDFAGDDWLDRRGFLSMLRTGLLALLGLVVLGSVPTLLAGSLRLRDDRPTYRDSRLITGGTLIVMACAGAFALVLGWATIIHWLSVAR